MFSIFFDDDVCDLENYQQKSTIFQHFCAVKFHLIETYIVQVK